MLKYLRHISITCREREKCCRAFGYVPLLDPNLAAGGEAVVCVRALISIAL